MSKSVEQKNFSAESIPRMVKETVRSVAPDAEVILFGSRARGDYGSDSDWDFLVLVDGSADWEASRPVHDALFDALLIEGVPVSCVIHSKSEWNTPYSKATPFYKNVARDGVAL